MRNRASDMQSWVRTGFGLGLVGFLLVGAVGQARKSVESRVPLTFIGGHDTEPRDHGRPVVLVAGGLGVRPEVFREAFSHVTPAAADREPNPGQVHRNKDALLSALGRYGITNDQLDEVSDYYRYNPSRGEMWPTAPATGYAIVVKGAINRIVITNPGSGYSSPPAVSLPGYPTLRLRAVLDFGVDLRKNGTVTSVAVVATQMPNLRPPSSCARCSCERRRRGQGEEVPGDRLLGGEVVRL